MTEEDLTAQLKCLTRKHMRLVWQLAQISSESLSEDEQFTVAAMSEHPQYAHLWDQLDQLSDDEITADGTNPILHVTMHAVIEKQIAGGDPPETGQAVTALEQRGFAHHEAVHRVAAVLADEIWHMLNEHRPFDQARYAANLAGLLRFRPSRPGASARRSKRRHR